jgi:hypothetical protein
MVEILMRPGIRPRVATCHDTSHTVDRESLKVRRFRYRRPRATPPSGASLSTHPKWIRRWDRSSPCEGRPEDVSGHFWPIVRISQQNQGDAPLRCRSILRVDSADAGESRQAKRLFRPAGRERCRAVSPCHAVSQVVGPIDPFPRLAPLTEGNARCAAAARRHSPS